MSRMGALILFTIIANIVIVLVSAMGFSTGGLTAYQTVEDMNESYNPQEINTDITGIALVDDTLFGVSIIADSIGLVKDIVYVMIFGVYNFYYSILSFAGGGDSVGIRLLSSSIAVLHYIISFIGLIEFARKGDTGI